MELNLFFSFLTGWRALVPEPKTGGEENDLFPPLQSLLGHLALQSPHLPASVSRSGRPAGGPGAARGAHCPVKKWPGEGELGTGREALTRGGAPAE